ncbi:Ada metal-binding domain-containing protein [Fibrella arboris]|uniref:Ada metal-binding domain-containing protein n=1 Tax=Fibrella arboris TaxID=3242486 RepID=UPI003521D31C
MIRHTALGPTRFARLRALVWLVRRGSITLGGHWPGKLYGLLTCRAGQRMKASNRVFFRDSAEAVAAGFRPCAVCLPAAYASWKARQHADQLLNQPDTVTGLGGAGPGNLPECNE